MSILAKFKDFVKAYEIDIIIGIGVALVSLLSFAIGYLVAKDQLKEPIQIEYNLQENNGTEE